MKNWKRFIAACLSVTMIVSMPLTAFAESPVSVQRLVPEQQETDVAEETTPEETEFEKILSQEKPYEYFSKQEHQQSILDALKDEELFQLKEYLKYAYIYESDLENRQSLDADAYLLISESWRKRNVDYNEEQQEQLLDFLKKTPIYDIKFKSENTEKAVQDFPSYMEYLQSIKKFDVPKYVELLSAFDEVKTEEDLANAKDSFEHFEEEILGFDEQEEITGEESENEGSAALEENSVEKSKQEDDKKEETDKENDSKTEENEDKKDASVNEDEKKNENNVEDIETDKKEKAVTIVGFSNFDVKGFVPYKEIGVLTKEKSQIAEVLDDKIEVSLADGSTKKINVKWECDEDPLKTEYELYTYHAKLENDYVLSKELQSQIDKGEAVLPYIDVKISDAGNSNVKTDIVRSKLIKDDENQYIEILAYSEKTKEIEALVWTEESGKDDLEVCSLKSGSWEKDGLEYNFRVKVSVTDHNNEMGIYHVELFTGNNLAKTSEEGYDAGTLAVGAARIGSNYYASLEDAFTALNNGSVANGSTIYLLQNVSMGWGIVTTKAFTLLPEGGNRTITLTVNDYDRAGMITDNNEEGRPNYSTWTFGGNQYSLTLNGNNRCGTSVIGSMGGTINLKSGVHIINSWQGGVWTGGTVNIYDGAQIHNNAGSGILCRSFNMYGGSIYSNGRDGIATSYPNGSSTMSAGNIYSNGRIGVLIGSWDDISGNTGAQFPHTFKMSGGTIYKNGSDGVVLAQQKTFIQTGGNINDNGQDGIRTEAGNTTLNLSGGRNYGNKRNAIWNYGTATINNTYGMGYTSWSNTDNFVSANNVNGNIYNKGTFTVNTNTGYVCSAHNGSGYHIYNDTGGTFNMWWGDSGTYHMAMGGTASTAIVNKGTFTMNKGTVMNAQTGVQNYAGAKFTFAGGTIKKCTTRGVTNSGTFNMTAGTISNNKSDYGAGITTDGTVNISGGTITANTASADGGAIHINGNNAVVNISGGTISNNKAANSGGGIMNWNGTLTLTGGTISGNTALNGKGIYSNDILRMSGNGSVNTNNDIYLTTNHYVTVTGALNKTSGQVALLTPQNYGMGRRMVEVAYGSKLGSMVYKYGDGSQKFGLTPNGSYVYRPGNYIDASAGVAGNFLVLSVPYTITYNKNTSSTVSSLPGKTTVYWKEKGTISSTKPTRTGYTFKGWNANSGGTGTAYNAGQAVVLSGNLNLYAQWAPNTYTNKIWHRMLGVTGDDGQSLLLGITDFTAVYNTTYKMDASLSTKIPNGYALSNTFRYNNNGTYENYALGETMTQKAGSMSYVYMYDAIDYKITYNLNEGTNNSGNPSKYNVLNGVTLKAPTRKGYTFEGWYLGDKKVTGINEGKNAKFSSVDEMYAELAKRTTGDVTLTAKWTPFTYKITYKGNGSTDGMEKTHTFTQKDIDTNGYVLKINKGYTDFARTKYTFMGWYQGSVVNTKADMTKIYKEGNKLTDSQLLAIHAEQVKKGLVQDTDPKVKNIILYAVWDEAPGISIDQSKKDKFFEGVDVTRAELLSGITASDKIDGNLTDQIIITQIDYSAGKLVNGKKQAAYSQTWENGMPADAKLDTWFMQLDKNDSPVTHTITYQVKDSAGNVTTAKKTVQVIYNEFPTIKANDFKFTLNEAQNGKITKDALLEKAIASGVLSASDVEDGDMKSKIELIDYDANAFKTMKQEGFIPITYRVQDSMGPGGKGKVTLKTVNVNVSILQKKETVRYVRFINKAYYEKNANLDRNALEGKYDQIALLSANGGLHPFSVWYTDPKYREAITGYLEKTTGTTYVYTKEDIKQMRKFVKQHGVGNAKEENGLSKFADIFMTGDYILK